MTDKPNDDLTRYADRLDRLLREADETRADLKELKAEIKSSGFDPAALVRVVQLRRDELKRVREEEKLQQVALYADRLGVQLSLDIK